MDAFSYFQASTTQYYTTPTEPSHQKAAQDLWYRRWAHLKYMDYLPRGPSNKKDAEEGHPAFQAPESWTKTTSTRRPNVFLGDDWLKKLLRKNRKKGNRRKATTLQQQLGGSSKKCHADEDDVGNLNCANDLVGGGGENEEDKDLTLKYVPVFPGKPMPYYKSVVVNEDGEVKTNKLNTLLKGEIKKYIYFQVQEGGVDSNYIDDEGEEDYSEDEDDYEYDEYDYSDYDDEDEEYEEEEEDGDVMELSGSSNRRVFKVFGSGDSDESISRKGE